MYRTSIPIEYLSIYLSASYIEQYPKSTIMLCHIVGESYVDLLCYLAASLPKQSEDSQLALPVQTMAGGSTLNTATHLRDLVRHRQCNKKEEEKKHLPPRIVVQTMLNPNDEYGTFLQRHAAQHDIQLINCCASAVAPGAGESTTSSTSTETLATPHCVVIVSEGDRTFMTYRGCATAFTGHDLQLKELMEYDGPITVHVAGLYCTPGFGDRGSLREQLVTLRRERLQRWPQHRTMYSLVTQFDVQKKWDGDLDDLVPHLQFLIMNEVEVNNIVHRAKGKSCADDDDELVEYSLQDWMTFFTSLNCETVFVVTRGAEGAIAFRGNQVIANLGPAVDVEVVDPTGAGDAFAAGFLIGVWEWDENSERQRQPQQQRWPDDKAVVEGVRWGCALGSASVTVRGASIPAPMDFILSMKNKQIQGDER